jgi:PAS domain S-box-containing protein
VNDARKTRALTIRQAILLVLIAVLVPAIVVEGVVYHKWYDSRMSTEVNRNLEMARTAAMLVNSLVSDIRRQEEAIGSSLLLLQPFTPQQLDRLLKTNAEQYESIRALSVADPEGVVIASNVPRGVGARIADRPYFHSIKSGAKGWVVSDLLADRVTGQLGFVVAVGTRDKGALQYVITATVDPARAGDILNAARSGRGVVVIFDSRGVPVMSAPDIPLKLESFAPKDRLLREALAGREAVGEMVSPIDEQARIGAKIPIADLGWVASATRIEKEALGPIARSFMISLGLIALVIIGSAAVAFLVSRRIIGSVRRLHDYAIAVGKGDVDRELAAGKIAELADLGDAFRETSQKRRQVEDELRVNEQRYRGLVELSPQAIFVNRNSRIEFVNPAAMRLFGATDPAEILGKSPFDVFHPDCHPIIRERIRRLQEGQPAPLNEERVVRLDGTVRDVEVAASVVVDREGPAIQVILHDITERKEAEEKLRKLSRAVEQSPATVVITDTDGTIEYVNPQFTRSTGYTFDEAVGKNPRVLKSDRTPSETFEQLWKTIKAGGDWHGEFCNRKKNGELYWESASISPIVDGDGRVTHYVAIKIDITERKLAEAALQRSNQRLEILSEIAARLLAAEEPQRIVESLCGKVMAYLDCQAFFNFLVDERAGRLHLNACAGIPAEAAKQIEWLDFGVAVSGCAARDGCRIVAENIPATPDPRTDLVRSYGIQAYACHPLLSAGKVIGTLSFGTTNRLRFTNDELAMMKAVSDQVAIAMERKQTVEILRQTADELARSNRDLEQFAYVASHDLQEPLRTVAGYLQLIERRYRSKLDKDADEFIDFAVDGALRLKQLINDLLSYSRVGTRGRPFEPTNCNDVLEVVLDGLGGVIRDSHSTVTHDTLPTIMGDGSQIAQLFQNLIANAIKFRSDEPPRIHVSAKRAGTQWQFSVRDNGIGMEPQYFDRIFVVFQRLHTRARYPGTGIGLAICKKIVDRHGGRIWVESESGKGSTFYFTLSGGAA